MAYTFFAVPLTALSVASLAGFPEWLSKQAAAILVSDLWQGAVLTVLVAISLRLAPRATATLRFTVWSAAFLVLVCLPALHLLPDSLQLVQFPTLAAARSTGSAGIVPKMYTRIQPLLHLDMLWALAIAALWIAASLYRAADLALHCIRLGRLWRCAMPLTQAEGSSLSELALGSSGRQTVICTTRDLDRPSVIGFFAPRILIPEWLLNKLTAEELEQIVLHEAEHLRRRDDWSNLLQKLSLIAFPLNPALFWIERRLCREREMACDEGVIRRTHAPRAYATCLTRLAETSLYRRAEALSLGSLGRRSELGYRVQSILRRTPFLDPLGNRVLACGMIAGLLVGSFALTRSPQLVAFVAPEQETAGNSPHAAPTVAGTTAGDYSTDPVTAPLALASAARHGLRAAPVAAHIPQVRQRSAQFSRPEAVTELPTTSALIDPASRPQAGSGVRTESAMATDKSTAEDVAANQPAPARSESWVVLTAWTQPEAPQEAFPGDSQQDPLQDQDSSSASGQLSHQILPARPNRPAAARPAMTPLIFTFGDPNSLFPAFAAVPTRMGWLVIQL